MRTGATISYAIAVVSLALWSANLAAARTTQNSTHSTNVMTMKRIAPGAAAEAKQMVPARAALVHLWDANKLKPGDRIEAKLADRIHLKNGTELPSGTMLMGVVSTDNMHPGNSKLALRFTEAKLKHGGTVPITATIIGVFPPQSHNDEGYDVVPGDQQPNSWTASELQVDQLNALSGIDLHSRIDGKNSGVFVTTKKDDVKLDQGSELTLAIGARNRQSAMNGSGL